MSFDLDGARKAGYSEGEIASYLADQRGFDIDGARKSGYSDKEIFGHLTQPEQGDFGRGFKTAFQQLPQLGYGLAALGASALESAVGEGGMATAAKKWSVEGYKGWGDKIALNSKETDELDVSWERAKEGDYGALIDWLQYGLGYTVAQGAQVLGTGGVGYVVGKTAGKAAVEKMAAGLVAKEAEALVASGAAKTVQAATPIAVANVAGKFGQWGAIGAQAYGMEGGEIGGDLAARSVEEGRSLSGSELAKAFAATTLAGSLEFAADALGYSTLLGKTGFGFKHTPGVAGKAGRALTGAAINAPAEGGTEFGQTLLEEYGKGNDPTSPEAMRQAKNAAALGALGGTVYGGVGGAMSRPEPMAEILRAPNEDAAIAAADQAVFTADVTESAIPGPKLEGIAGRVQRQTKEDPAYAQLEEQKAAELESARAQNLARIEAEQKRLADEEAARVAGDRVAAPVLESDATGPMAEAMRKAVGVQEGKPSRFMQEGRMLLERMEARERAKAPVAEPATTVANPATSTTEPASSTPAEVKIFGKTVDQISDGDLKVAAQAHPMSASRFAADAELKRRQEAKPAQPAPAIGEGFPESRASIEVAPQPPQREATVAPAQPASEAPVSVAAPASVDPAAPQPAASPQISESEGKPPVPALIMGKTPDKLKVGELKIAAKKGKTKAIRAAAEAELERRADALAAKPMSEAETARRASLKAKAEGRKQVDPERDSILAAVAKLGGINASERLDITGDDRANHGVMGVGYAFSKNGTGVDDMATLLGQYGYLTKQELEDVDGGVQALKDKIREEIGGGRKHYALGSTVAMEEKAKREQEEREDQETAEEAARILRAADYAKLSAEEQDAELDSIFGPRTPEAKGAKPVADEAREGARTNETEVGEREPGQDDEEVDGPALGNVRSDQLSRPPDADKGTAPRASEVGERGGEQADRPALNLSAQTESSLRAKEAQAQTGKVEERTAAVRDRNEAILSSPEGTAPPRSVAEAKVPTQQEALFSAATALRDAADTLAKAVSADAEKPAEGETPKPETPQKPMFSRGKTTVVPGTRDLIIQHNVTASNLLHAARMGGFPVVEKTAKELGEKVMFSRKPTFIQDEQGRPLLATERLRLVEPRTIPGIFMFDGTPYDYRVVDKNDPSRVVGVVTLNWKNGKVRDLLYIKTAKNLRGKGIAEEIVRGILQHNEGTPLRAIHVVASARGFWQKMGAEFVETEDGEDGFLTLKDYEASRGENPAQSGQGTGKEPPAFRQGEARPGGARESRQGLTPDAIRAQIAPVLAKWKNAPQVEVIESMADAPAEVREQDEGQRSGGATGDPEGFFWRGKVYLVADGLSDPAAVYRTLFHETLGHAGLRGVFGDKLNPILDDVARSLKGRVQAKAKQYGLDFDNADERRQAAEEVLAELAQTMPNSSVVKRLVAAIKQFLLDLGIDIDLTESDVIAQYILPARGFVERGRGSASGIASFHRAFHGSPHDFDEFSLSKIGTGEGAQAYGWGLYFSSKRGVAEHYRAQLSDMVVDVSGKKVGVPRDGSAIAAKGLTDAQYWAARAVASAAGMQEWKEGAISFLQTRIPQDDAMREAILDAQQLIKDNTAILERRGRVYSVDLAPKENEYLDWDKPLNGQSAKVRQALLSLESAQHRRHREQWVEPGWSVPPHSEKRAYEDAIGADQWYRALSEELGGQEAASKALLAAGVPGIRYLDGSSRGAGEGSHNYVIFDGKHVKIEARFARASGNRASWDAPETGRLDTLIRVMQDKHIDTKRVVQAIKNAVGALKDSVDVYLQEELFHGRAAKGLERFLDQEMRPLLTDMAARGITREEFEEYLHARHAEERNVQIAKVNPDMPDGGSGMDTADARAYLEKLEPAKRRSYEALAKRVDAINATTRRALVAYGLESQQAIDAWEAAYENYVPLQREDMDGGGGTGQGFSVRGGQKRATGSKRAVVDILANIAMQRERAIVRGEKNRVALALVGLAEANPNEDFWRVDSPPKIKYIDDRTGLVVERVDPMYRSRENVVMARMPDENGEIVERSVIFNEQNERAVRMAEALKNLDAADLGEVLGLSAKITRYFASVNTQYNPIFGVVNLIRDSQGAMLNLSTTPIAGKQADVLKNMLSALRGIYIDTRDARLGKDARSQWAELWEEFQREGGQTGYRDMFRSSKDRSEAIERELKRVTEGKAKGFGRAVFDWLSDYNTAMENATRLAAYKVAKESGLSNQRAASLAKNLTVNFNRRGQIGTQAGALYAFFNASVQGTARLAETLAGPAGKKIITGGLMLGSAQALLLAAAGFDDDEPPEFVRERNLILPIGDGKYLTLPMPLGLHIIPNLSRIPTEYALSGFRDPGKRISELVNVFADAFNPIGNAGLSLQTIAPTVIDPIAALAENKDWTGKPIAREDFNKLAPTPGHARAKDTASEFSKAVSKSLNWLSGGTQYKPGIFSPTPDQIDYLVGQVTGGLGREAQKVEQTVGSSFTGEELPTYKIPLLGRFYGSSEGQAPQANAFYENLRTINEHEAEIKGRRKAGEPLGDYVRENPEAVLIQYANHVERQISQLRHRKAELVQKNAPREQIKAIEDRMIILMRGLNDRVRSIREKEAA